MARLSMRIYPRTRFIFMVCVMFGVVRRASSSAPGSRVQPQPSFPDLIPNVTVSAGRDVSMPCTIDNLGNYRVAWTHKDKSTLISIQNRVIIRNSRYSVRNSNSRIWYLHIKKLEEGDAGQYMCQINTSPMISQIGFLQVVVPPYIDEYETSSDTDIREGEDVSLKCTAKGSPLPRITWRKEEVTGMHDDSENFYQVEDSFLNISKVSRLNMGAYLCIASNGIPPSVSKRILLRINFPPMVWIPNQLIGAPLGSDAAIICHVESHPHPVAFWTRESGQIVISGAKYDNLVTSSGQYKIQMMLRIRNLRIDDFGAYTCVTKNSLGETEGTIKLYEIPQTRNVGSSQSDRNMKAEKNGKGGEIAVKEFVPPGYNDCSGIYDQSIIWPSAVLAFYFFVSGALIPI